jgi:hypothetical protein
MAATTTAGVNQAAARSVMLWIGARLCCASATDFGADWFLDRQRFPGQHGFIDGAVPIDYFTVGGDAFTGPHTDELACLELGDGHFVLGAVVADPHGPIRC